MIPSLNSLQPPDHGAKVDAFLASEAVQYAATQEPATIDSGDENWPMPIGAMRDHIKQCVDASQSFMQQNVAPVWERSVKAYRNEHFAASKYKTPEWSSRSKVFKPKTRTAVRKQMDAAAKALFSSPDVVTLKPANEADDVQRASAAVKQHLLNYRLDRATGRAALPWFLISMGAVQDASVFGICASMQTWRYREKRDGTPLYDCPQIQLYPPEDVLIEPTAHWVRPEQNGAWLFLRAPTTVDDIVDLTRASGPSVQWLMTDRKKIEAAAKAATSENDTAAGVRNAREGGNDPRSNASASNPAKRLELMICFMRIGGDEYVIWTINGRELLSAPALVEDVFPWNGGERPVVIGYGTIDSHRIMPMSKVEALQPLQQEANDITNLRLDLMKQAAYPLVKILRGRNVDTVALNRRSPNQQIFVQEHDDIVFDRPPEVPGSTYQESNYINADFDELAGNFSGASVMTNRSLNETVGGMQLLAGSAASVGEFDTMVWSQTWVEPVLAQIVRLQARYESDERILVIAGERAKLVQKFGVDVITDEMLSTEATVSVNIGAGASDPMARLGKLQTAGQMVAGFLAKEFESGKVRLNARAVIDEAFGGAGYTDAGDRFFTFADEKEGGQPPPDPAQAMLQAKMAEVEMNKQVKMAEAQAKAEVDQIEARAEIARKDSLAQAEIMRRNGIAQAGMVREAETATARHRTMESSSFLKSMIDMNAAQRREAAKPAEKPRQDNGVTAQDVVNAIRELAEAIRGGMSPETA